MAFAAFNQAVELFNQIYTMRKETKEMGMGSGRELSSAKSGNSPMISTITSAKKPLQSRLSLAGPSKSKRKAGIDESAFGSHRYRPHTLDQLVRETRFTKQEIQRLYRGIKQFCPTGMVDMETFNTIFKTLFPQGDPAGYAELVFMSFDSGRKMGLVTFDEIVETLSTLFRGTDDEKLLWVFRLYDSNRDGKLTPNDLLAITRSVYSILGRWTLPHVSDESFQDHCASIFSKMDQNGDGEVSCDEFVAYCKMRNDIVDSMHCLDTVI